MKKLFKIAVEEGIVDAPETVTETHLQQDADAVNEASVKVEDSTAEIETAVDAVDALTNLVDVVEQKPEGEDVTPTEARVVEVALEQIYNSLGMSRPQVLSLEAEGGVSGFIARVKEQTIKILIAIAEVFRKAFDWLSDFVAKATNAANRLGKYATKLHDDTRGLKGTPLAPSYKNKPLYTRLYTDGTKTVEAYGRVTELVTDAVKSANSEHVQMLNKIIDDYAASNMADTVAQIKLIDAFPDVLKKAFDKFFPQEVPSENLMAPIEGTTAYATKTLLGNYVGIMTLPDAVSTLRHFDFVIRHMGSDVQGMDKQDDEGKIVVATPQEIDGLLRDVIENCSIIAHFTTEERKLEGISTRLTRSIEKFKRVDVEISKEQREFLRTLVSMAPAIARGIHQRCFGFALKASGAIVSHCQTSAKLYPA